MTAATMRTRPQMKQVDQCLSKSRRKTTVAQSVVCVVLVAFLCVVSLNESTPKPLDFTSYRRLQQQAEEDDRPIIYTYYQAAKTDMTNDADVDLLKNWQKAWWDAGWRPFILTESDARKLPEFDQLIQLVADPKHIGSYNMACYIRWIAMAAVGGGWMVDYDTFPLNHFLRHGRKLPFAGQLTVWQNIVPALVSGNGSEYLRIVKQIGNSMQQHVHKQQHINKFGPKDQHRNHLQWSDMLALAELYNEVSDDMFIRRRHVLSGDDALQKVEWTAEDCQMAAGMRAVHFSHKAMEVGKQAYRGAIHRGTVARQFLNMFHRVCDFTPVADD